MLEEQAPPTKRGPKPRLNLDAVLDAAAALPYQELTMAAVAARVGVSTPTLYGYVDGRDALMSALAQRLSRALEPPNSELPWQAWTHELARVYFGALTTNPILASPEAWTQVARAGLRLITTGHAVLRRDGFSAEQARTLIGAALSLAHANAVQSLNARPRDGLGEAELDEGTLEFLASTYDGCTYEQFLQEQVELTVRGARPGGDAAGTWARKRSTRGH